MVIKPFNTSVAGSTVFAVLLYLKHTHTELHVRWPNLNDCNALPSFCFLTCAPLISIWCRLLVYSNCSKAYLKITKRAKRDVILSGIWWDCIIFLFHDKGEGEQGLNLTTTDVLTRIQVLPPYKSFKDPALNSSDKSFNNLTQNRTII